MKNDLVSVIIPTYKRPDTLSRAVKSVLSQTYPAIEVIIVDDNDPTSSFRVRTEAVMRPFLTDSRVIYIKHEKNINGAAARNTGINHAKGEYMAFLDDDDEFYPQKIEKQVRRLKNQPEDVGAIYCAYAYYNGNKIIKKMREKLEGDLSRELLLKQISLAAGSTLLIRSKAIKALGGFDESFNRHQDWELLVRFFRNYKIVYIDEILANLNLDSAINRSDPDKMLVERLKYLDKFKDEIARFDEKTKADIYKAHFLEVARAYCLARKYRGMFKMIKTINNMNRISMQDILLLIIDCLDGLFHVKNIAKNLMASR